MSKSYTLSRKSSAEIGLEDNDVDKDENEDSPSDLANPQRIGVVSEVASSAPSTDEAAAPTIAASVKAEHAPIYRRLDVRHFGQDQEMVLFPRTSLPCVPDEVSETTRRVRRSQEQTHKLAG